MAEVYKILGSSAPAAPTPAPAYTVPGATSAIVSSITVCDRTAAAATFRISLLPGGSTGLDTFIAYDHAIAANETVVLTLGVGLATTDEVEVYGSSTGLSFNVFGMEIT